MSSHLRNATTARVHSHVCACMRMGARVCERTDKSRKAGPHSLGSPGVLLPAGTQQGHGLSRASRSEGGQGSGFLAGPSGPCCWAVTVSPTSPCAEESKSPKRSPLRLAAPGTSHFLRVEHGEVRRCKPREATVGTMHLWTCAQSLRLRPAETQGPEKLPTPQGGGHPPVPWALGEALQFCCHGAPQAVSHPSVQRAWGS